MRDLNVYLYGELVASLGFSAGGAVSLDYASRDSRSLSLSLPNDGTRLKPATVRNFFDNLLPDSEPVRARWAAQFSDGRHRVSPKNPFALLEFMGRDVSGALEIVPDGEPQRVSGDFVRLSATDVESRLRSVRDDAAAAASFADPDTLAGRFSLAGAESKIALTSFDGGKTFYSPDGAAPSTHILKPSGGPYRDGDLIEHVTGRTAALTGLSTAESTYREFGTVTALVSTRYDRHSGDDGVLTRVHQEDLCQALGVAPDRKYQDQGGPGAGQIASFLHQFVGEEAALAFIDAQAFSWAVANTDGHAKNYSILHNPDGGLQVAPLYDLCSYLPYEPERGTILPNGRPYTGCALAMRIGRSSEVNAIGEAGWRSLADAAGLDQDMVLCRVTEILERVPDAADAAVVEVEGRGDARLLRRYRDRVAQTVDHHLDVLPGA